MGCQQPGVTEDQPASWQLGVGASHFITQLAFDDGYEPIFEQQGLAVSGTLLLQRGWSLRAAAGLLAGGKIVGPPTGNMTHWSYTLDRGWQVSAQASKRFVEARGVRPYVAGSLGLAVGRSHVVSGEVLVVRMLATDLRLGAAAGWDVGGVWSPYLSAQVFGGPVVLTIDEAGSAEQRALGTDQHHYRVSLGSSFFLGDHLSLYVDAAPVGERGVAVGAGWRI